MIYFRFFSPFLENLQYIFSSFNKKELTEQMYNASLFVSYGVNFAFGRERLIWIFYCLLLSQSLFFKERVTAACGISVFVGCANVEKAEIFTYIKPTASSPSEQPTIN